jgi:RNA polymerase sigma-70 factor (sigma-E family)
VVTPSLPRMTAEEELTELYLGAYARLVRLAAFVGGSSAGAEDIVQEAYVRVATTKTQLKDPGMMLAYLRRAIVNLCHSNRRHLVVVDRHAASTGPMPDIISAEQSAMTAFDRDDLVTALRGLPRRQRECVVLRHYIDMTEAQTAETLEISVGAVKSYTSRGLAALASALGRR